MPDATTTRGQSGVIRERLRGALASIPRAWKRVGLAAMAFLPLLAAPWVSRALIRPAAFNSDLAIPVLMMRAREWTLFDAYYWGQDRLGAWHLLLMRAAGQLTGHTFDYGAMHLVGAAWVLAGAVVMARLAGAWGWAAGGLLAAVLVGNTDSRVPLFDAAHPYAWQITALLLAWWGLRRLADRDEGSGRWGMRAATAFAVFLAHWTSPLSGQMLLAVACVEAVRARALNAAPGRPLLRRLAEGGMVVIAGMLAERVLRIAFYRHTEARFGKEFRTGLVWDRGHLADNARRVMATLADSASMPMLVMATAGACAALVVLWRAMRGGGREPAWRVEGAALVLACWTLAAVQVPVFFLVRHVRINRFHERYFSLVYVFGTLAGLIALVCLAASLPWLARRWRAVRAVAGTAGVAAALLLVPAPAPPRANAPARLAARLEARAPGAPLLGGYWSTYVVAALQRPGTMLHPVPCEGRMDRTPWWSEEVDRRRWIVAVHSYECVDAGTGESPAPWMYQHGALLRLARPRWEQGAGFTLSLYENASARALPHVAEPSAAAWRYCNPRANLRLRFAARGEAEVMVARAIRSPAATLSAAPVYADGRVGAAVRMTATGRLHRAKLRADGAPLVGARITAHRSRPPPDPQKCRAAATFVVD